MDAENEQDKSEDIIMMDRVQQLVVEAGLPWAQGNAVISIFDGDIENAVAFLELTERGEVAKDEQGEAPAKKAKMTRVALCVARRRESLASGAEATHV